MAKYYQFDSGLVLLYEKNNINKETNINIDFDCGARCDGKLPGLSHFVEHMFFSGTDKLSKQEVYKRYFDFISANAFTGFEDIVFTAKIITTKLQDYLSAVQDMICNSTFSTKAVEEEKQVVIQEIIREADKHNYKAINLSNYDLFEQDYYKNGVLGSKETVSQIKSKDVKNYVKKYFVKNNCRIYICTPLSFGKVKQIVEKYFDKKMPSNNLKPLPYAEEKLVKGDKVSLYNVDIDKNFLDVVFKFDKKYEDLKYGVILSILKGVVEDLAGGLIVNLRLENSLVYGVNASYMFNYVNSYFGIHTEISKENIKPCLKIVSGYIKNLVKNGITSQQLKNEKDKNDYYYQTEVITPYKIKKELYNHRLYGRFVTRKEIYNSMQSITIEELNQTIKELFSNTDVLVFAYGNANRKDLCTLKQLQNGKKIY